MEYERLTDEKFIKAVETCNMACVYGEACIECVYFNVDYCGEIIQGKLKKAIPRLAELEDKIENGTLIELKDRKPLMWGKDGNTVHCQHCGEDLMGVFDGETEVIQCPQCGGFVNGSVAEDYDEKILKE